MLMDWHVSALRRAAMLRWLRVAQNDDELVSTTSQPPRLHGVWGEAAERVRKIIKLKDCKLLEAQLRLDEFSSHASFTRRRGVAGRAKPH